MHILCIYVLTRYFYGGQIYKAILAGLRDKKAKWPNLGGREGSHTVYVNIYIGKSGLENKFLILFEVAHYFSFNIFYYA